MPSGPRILHLADSHIGADLPARRRSARPRRGDDFVASYQKAVRNGLDRGAQLIIHAGDVFDLPSPSPAALAAAAGPLLEAAAAGIPVVIVPGNHERSALPASLLFSHANIHVVRQPCTLPFRVDGTRVAVAALPCLRRGAAERFAPALQSTGWPTSGADILILAAHQTFESAVCGPARFRFRSGADVVERSDVPPEFHYVAAGHVHPHQVLPSATAGGPAIVYAGSTDRISFAELGEPKGAVLVDFAGGAAQFQFVEHEVRPMAIVPLDVSGLRAAQVAEHALDAVNRLPGQVVAQVRLTGQAAPHELRGLNLARRLRAQRPDALLQVSTQGVEFVSHRQILAAQKNATTGCAGVFGALRAAGRVTARAAEPPPHIADRSNLADLPKCRGTYALFGGSNRLLYVGKAGDVRTRVRTHLRGDGDTGRYRGWTAAIERIEVRPAHSELEALLVEAELIRRLRPPFNRQMRHWSRYCYLCEDGTPLGQLQICRDAAPDLLCFGPYRSRAIAERIREAVAVHLGLALCPTDPSVQLGGPAARPAGAGGSALCARYFRRDCVGPCAGRSTPADYEARRTRRSRLLLGIDDVECAVLEERVACLAARNSDDSFDNLRRRSDALRAAYERGRLLRAAENLVGLTLHLPTATGSASLSITLDRSGIGFQNLYRGGTAAPNGNGIDIQALICGGFGAPPAVATGRAFGSGDGSAAGVPRLQVPHGASPPGSRLRRLPRETADTFCTIVQELRRRPDVHTLAAEQPAARPANIVSTRTTAEPRTIETTPPSNRARLGSNQQPTDSKSATLSN